MEFEVPLEEAAKIRKWAWREGAELLPQNNPGAFTSTLETIQVLGTEPLVVSPRRLKDASGIYLPHDAMMRIITSDKIAEREGFQEIISSNLISKPKRPRFDRSKLPSRKEVEESVRRGEKEMEAELNRRQLLEST